MVKVLITKLNEDAKLPSYAHEGDSGMDLHSCEDAVIPPNERALISTGIKIAVPKGHEAQVRPKSGLAANYGVTVLNTPGTIDSGYRGEIKVILYNASGNEFKITKGMKIAQIIIAAVEHAELEETAELDMTSRNHGGFGSTGLH